MNAVRDRRAARSTPAANTLQTKLSDAPRAAGRAAVDDLDCAAGASAGQLAALDAAVQRVHAAIQADGAVGAADVRDAAASGIAGGGGALPHLDTIRAAFGAHDVSGVRAHVGGAAADASRAMGAKAYASGDHVAFDAAPSLHTAAHEAAHVIQQRGGVQLAGGVGQAGDRYERHADAVADAVVEGRSAEALLEAGAGGGADGLTAPPCGRGAPRGAVQRESATFERAHVSGKKVWVGRRGERSTITPEGHNGKVIYLFCAFSWSYWDLALRRNADHANGMALRGAVANGYRVVIDNSAEWSELVTALTDPASAGIVWTGHGTAGMLKDASGEAHLPSSLFKASKTIDRYGEAHFDWVPKIRASPSLRLLYLISCFSAQAHRYWQKLVPAACKIVSASDLVMPNEVFGHGSAVALDIQNARR